MADAVIRAEQVDPRDVQAEAESPVYRVYFIETSGATDEYRLTGAADVREVLRWGDENAQGLPFHVFLETNSSAGRRMNLLAVQR